MDPTDAEHLAATTDPMLAETVERRSHSILGTVEVESERGMFPLRVETAERWPQDASGSL